MINCLYRLSSSSHNSYYIHCKKSNVSPTTVHRILDTKSFGLPSISQTISIDKFKGNAGGQKYQCILVDPVKYSVLDILPSKSQAALIYYFRPLPKTD